MSGGGGTNTNTTTEAIPAFEQQSSENNQALAASIGSQPYPQYQGALVQGFTPAQQQGQQMAINSANAYQPDLTGAENMANTAVGSGSQVVGAATQASAGAAGQAQALTNPNAVSSYMSPYIQAQLAPTLSNLGIAEAQNQNTINQGATQANAFGDARQGVAQGLQNMYYGQAVNQATTGAYQNAFTAANQALGQAQNTNIQAANAYGNLGTLGVNEQGQQLTGANDLANYGASEQTLGEAGASAVQGVGATQQALGQQELTNAYQQYINQVNWPVQMLNVQESALSNSPYDVSTATTLPNGNSTVQGIGALTALGGLFGGSTLGGTGATGSDYRLKDLTDEESDGSLIDKLEVHVGSFKVEIDPEQTPRSMLVAHEAQEHAPWAVIGEKDAPQQIQLVNHSLFVPDLIAKCQHLQAENDDMKEMMHVMHTRLAALENRVDV